MCKKLIFLMSVVLVLGLVGSVPADDNPGRGAYIILLADGSEEALETVEEFLEPLYPGVSIELDVDERYKQLDAGKIANLKSANLIIVTDNAEDDEYNHLIGGTPFPEPNEGVNLALNKSAVSSSNQSGSYLPGNAVDGDVLTRWSSEWSDPQWIYVDLGAQLTVNAVRINWEAAYAKSYKIQVSNNAVDWDDVYSTASGSGGSEQVDFADVAARYVRMYGTERAEVGGTLYGYSLWEFEVFEFTPIAGPPYQESGGICILEAEDAVVSKRGDIMTWGPATEYSGYAGSSYMTTPNLDTEGWWMTACELAWDVNIATPGEYFIAARCTAGPEMDGDDSEASVGVGGVCKDFETFGGSDDKSAWTWQTAGDSLGVLAAGIHTIQVRRGEDGFNIDRVMIVNDPNKVPAGVGSTLFWNTLGTPILLCSNGFGYSGSNPNTNWRWFDTTAENEDYPQENLYIDVNDACDPIWDGVTLEDGDEQMWLLWYDYQGTIEVPAVNDAGYGTVLALIDAGFGQSPPIDPNLILARWLPGTQFWDDPDNPQIAGGPRFFFAMRNISGTLDDLSPVPYGKKLLENAITELLWYSFDPNFAYGPYPKVGETDVDKGVPLVLSWSPGDNVKTGGGENGHKIFFSSNWADVNDHNEAALVKDPNFRDSTSLDAPIYLNYGQTYYWRVDEYNDTHPDSPWLGHIWSFTMEKSVTGEDWEDYPSTTQMMEYWSETSKTTLNLQHIDAGGTVHDGNQSMYMNTYQEVGTATRTFLPPTKWDPTVLDPPEPAYQAMGVWFHGDAGNVIAGAQLYLTIEDYFYHNTATVHYDGDMNDLADPNWHQWAIDLAVFRNAGVNLEGVGGALYGVKYLKLGFGNAGEDSSTIYFDDIGLFEWMCLDEDIPDFDFTGPGGIPDCVVDVWDFGAFSDVWLEYEYDIYAAPVTDPCVAHWDFEEGTGDIVADSVNGNTGRFFVDCNYPDGYSYEPTNDPCWVDPSTDPCWVEGTMGNWALHFDGSDFVRIEAPNGVPGIECANDSFTMCIWLNYDEYDEEDPDAHPGSMAVFYKGSDKDETWPVYYDQSPFDASEKRYHMHFSPGGTEGDSDLSIQLDDDGSGSTGGKTRIHGYAQMDPGVWYHATIQRHWDAHKLRVYLNAEILADEDDESWGGSGISSPNEPLFIGMKPTDGPLRWDAERFIGKLDDFRIYKAILPAEQILSVMGLSYRTVPVRHTEFNPVEDGIINFGDAAVMAENWGVNTRFP